MARTHKCIKSGPELATVHVHARAARGAAQTFEGERSGRERVAAVCHSSQIGPDTATRALRLDKRGPIPPVPVLSVHSYLHSLQTSAVSPDLQKHAPLLEQISQEAALSSSPQRRRRLKGGGRGGVPAPPLAVAIGRNQVHLFACLLVRGSRVPASAGQLVARPRSAFSFVWMGVVAPKPSPH